MKYSRRVLSPPSASPCASPRLVTDSREPPTHAPRVGRSGSGLRALFATLALLVVTACRAGDEPLPAGTPVVLVIIDTLSAEHLATYGYDLETAPNLTAFCEHATLFENHTTQCNSTFPSISSILTGLYQDEQYVLLLWRRLTHRIAA